MAKNRIMVSLLGDVDRYALKSFPTTKLFVREISRGIFLESRDVVIFSGRDSIRIHLIFSLLDIDDLIRIQMIDEFSVCTDYLQRSSTTVRHIIFSLTIRSEPVNLLSLIERRCREHCLQNDRLIPNNN